MRAFVVNSQLTLIMQAADLFNKNRVIFQDLNLGYKIDGVETIDEDMILALAKCEFKQDLILLCGKEKPLYINPGIQVISTGKQWIRLWDVVTKLYPNIEFQSDEYFTSIQIKN